ncbi:DUF5995 family protein [Egicoccus sp. AB-alg2]|uniref:DUF5995 family protein n=1 Tax=Egicoccus sp. AB-alg2 TaxID=3242693 RepID=UPI00359ECDD6
MPEVGQADTIDDVLAALDDVVARSIEQQDRVGYFAALYRTVTAKVKEGIEQGRFDDVERMARLDVVFANRYLDALAGFRAGTPITHCWQAALDAAGQRRPLILQQLLVGINAHINLDLGIAAATVAPGAQLSALRRDFDRINEILAAQIATVADDVGSLSPWIGFLRLVGGRREDELVRFSIEVARTQAWWFARELATLPPDQWGGPIGARDAVVTRLARRVLHPGGLLGTGLLVVRARERNDVAHNIRVLGRLPGPDLAVVDARVREERHPDG